MMLLLCSLLEAKSVKLPPAPPVVTLPVVAPVEAPKNPLDTPPVVSATADFQPPTPVTQKLANGAGLWVVPQPGLPLVSVVIEVPGGSSTDPLGSEGQAALSDRLMSQGAGELDAEAFAEKVARLGIQLDVGTGVASSFLSISAHKDRMEDALSLAADMILSPHYKGGEFRRERGLSAMDVAMSLDEPVAVARRLANALYFGVGSAWGRPTDGTMESVRRLKLKRLKDYHAQAWKPGSARITAAGELSATEAKALLDRHLGAWAGVSEFSVPAPAVPAPSQPGTIYLVDRPGSAQTVFYLLFPGVPYGDKAEAASRSGTIALGGTFTSRLNALLREEKGFTYGVRATMVQYAQTGRLLISTRIRTDATAEAMTLLVGELKKIRDGGISAEEAQKARLAWQQDNVEAMESRSGIAGTFSEYHFAGMAPESLTAALGEMRGVELSAVQQAMQAYDPAKGVIVMVGDRAKIEAELKNAGFTNIAVMDAI